MQRGCFHGDPIPSMWPKSSWSAWIDFTTLSAVKSREIKWVICSPTLMLFLLGALTTDWLPGSLVIGSQTPTLVVSILSRSFMITLPLSRLWTTPISGPLWSFKLTKTTQHAVRLSIFCFFPNFRKLFMNLLNSVAIYISLIFPIWTSLTVSILLASSKL